MYFDYIAHPFSKNLISALEKNPDAFLTVFFEASYADDFEEMLEDCTPEINQIGEENAQEVFKLTGKILENEALSLEMDGENWFLPLHFFLSGEFSEEQDWQQAKPNFTDKVENGYQFINVLLAGNIIKTPHQNMVILPPNHIANMLEKLNIVLSEDFAKRWDYLTKQSGQYLDNFANADELNDFIEDLKEFIQSILVPFLKLAHEKNSGIVAFLD